MLLCAGLSLHNELQTTSCKHTFDPPLKKKGTDRLKTPNQTHISRTTELQQDLKLKQHTDRGGEGRRNPPRPLQGGLGIR